MSPLGYFRLKYANTKTKRLKHVSEIFTDKWAESLTELKADFVFDDAGQTERV